MTCEKHVALGLVASLAERFGPESKIAKELPGWIEYLADVECPEKPRTGTGAAWWGNVRSLLDDLSQKAAHSEGNVVRANAMRIGLPVFGRTTRGNIRDPRPISPCERTGIRPPSTTVGRDRIVRPIPVPPSVVRYGVSSPPMVGARTPSRC